MAGPPPAADGGPSEPEPAVFVRILAPSGEVVLEAEVPGKRTVAVLLQSLLEEVPSGRLSLLRGTEVLPKSARFGELGLSAEESLYLVKRTAGNYTVLTSTADDPSDANAKCLLIGGPASGKSSLLKALNGDGFREEYVATIGVEFNTLRFQSDEGFTVKLQVWDTAGLERYRAIVNAYFRGAYGFLAVFSLASRASLEELQKLVGDAQRDYPESCRFICLVGTHADIPEPEVTEEEALRIAEEHHWPYFGISCKTGHQLNQPFFAWLDMYIDKLVQVRHIDG